MKIAFSGTHGTGKSTSVFELAHKMKLDYPGRTVGIFMDNARSSPFGFNKDKPEEAQMWIFSNQLVTEFNLSNKYDILILDRTIFDSIAYTYVFGQKKLADKLLQVGLHHMNSYDEIIFKSIEHNDYLTAEGTDRDIKDNQYRIDVENKLLEIYKYLKHERAIFKFTKI